MAKILLVLATIATAQPASQTFGGNYLFKINDAAQISAAPQITSDDLPDGTYAATCQSLDTTGAPIPDLVSISFTLAGGQIVVPGAPPAPAPAPAPATYPAPSALTATVVTS